MQSFLCLGRSAPALAIGIDRLEPHKFGSYSGPSDFREAFNGGNDYEKSNMKNEYVETYYKDRMGPGLVEEYSSKLWKSQHCH